MDKGEKGEACEVGSLGRYRDLFKEKSSCKAINIFDERNIMFVHHF